jgi:iron(II)-dependent oxidoreductase
MHRDWVGAGADRRELEAQLVDARRRTLDLVRDLDDEQLVGPRLAIVNPLRWEIGHLAWFQEQWTLRALRGSAPLREDGDQLYDSARVVHDSRWDLPLPSRAETLAYMDAVLERAIAGLVDCDRPEVAYAYRLALSHEDMHDEAFTYTRQTHGYPAPGLHGSGEYAAQAAKPPAIRSDPNKRFIDLPGGTFQLGSSPTDPFLFDNEKWAHEAHLEPFRMARTAVTNGEFASFVDDGGYADRRLWSEEGWAWRDNAGAAHPVYWRGARSHWEERRFDRWQPLAVDHAIIHVNWYEADAYCRWAGVRLPTEAEWEAAACSALEAPGAAKNLHPWGGAAPSSQRANLEGLQLGTGRADVLELGDTPAGLRQLVGDAWEWTATPFAPYPGFTTDPYAEYSAPWFDGRHMVLRGGSWATRARLVRNAYRNFYTRDRRDVFAGFRVCAR